MFFVIGALTRLLKFCSMVLEISLAFPLLLGDIQSLIP